MSVPGSPDERDQTIHDLRVKLHEAESARSITEMQLDSWYRTRSFRWTRPARYLWDRSRQFAHRIAPSLSHRIRRGPLQLSVGGSARYGIDAPRAGDVISHDALVDVTGWVVSGVGVISRVEVWVEGVKCEHARLGLPRPDVAAAIDDSTAHICGFEALVDIRDVDVMDDQLTITLWMETVDGVRRPIGSVTCALAYSPSNAPPRPTTVELEPVVIDRSSPIRLLAVTHSLGLGGGQLYLHEILRLLAERDGFRATILAPTDGPLRAQCEELGIQVVLTGEIPVAAHDRYEEQISGLVRWAQSGQHNVLVANTLGCFPGVDLAARLNIPAVWAIHDSFSLPEFWRAAYGSAVAAHPLVRRRMESALRSAAALIFEADATRDLLARHGDARRFVTLPYGIDTGEIDEFAEATSHHEARQQLGLPSRGVVFLCLGTIEPRKGQGTLAQAFSLVVPRHPEAALVFVGGRADVFTKGLESYIQGVRLTKQVRIVPITPDIYCWYRAADALVLASDVESLPRTALEAMAFGLPVIATNVFGLPELIDDGKTGYLCEARDTRSLAEALERFLDETPERRAQIGAAGSQLVHGQHDSRTYADAYYRLFQALVQHPRATPSDVLGSAVRPAA